MEDTHVLRVIAMIMRNQEGGGLANVEAPLFESCFGSPTANTGVEEQLNRPGTDAKAISIAP
jgi:hypothetical protein